MDTPLFLSLTGFAFAASITPGPNNFMLMSSGALFGWRRTLPHIAGIQIGFMSLMAASVFGLGVVIAQMPGLVMAVKIAGAAWLAWLALKFFAAALRANDNGAAPQTESRSRPLKFHEAAFFQWANPKGLIMAMTAAGAYIGLAQTIPVRAAIICGTFLAIGSFSSMAWAVAGGFLNQFMSSGLSAKLLNLVMGLLLLATAAIILLAKAHI